MKSPLLTLADTFLQSLAHEESLLRDALANVTALHAALRCGEAAESLKLSTQQETLGFSLREAAAARTESARELACEVGLSSEDVTLSALAAKLPEAPAAEVHAARSRLAAIADEIAATHTQNANLVTHLRSFFRGVLSGLTAPDAPKRYGRSGGTI